MFLRRVIAWPRGKLTGHPEMDPEPETPATFLEAEEHLLGARFRAKKRGAGQRLDQPRQIFAAEKPLLPVEFHARDPGTHPGIPLLAEIFDFGEFGHGRAVKGPRMALPSMQVPSSIGAVPVFLLVPVLLALVWSGIAPYDRLTWALEIAPVVIGLGVLWATRRRSPLTPLVYALIALHMVILCVGGKYTYARVPLGEWMREAWHLSRNHYDRLGHFAQGFVPAMIAREIFLRKKVIPSDRWRAFLVVCVCMTISAVYELIEWAVALVVGAGSDSFLGTQGDPWDTQTDMALALLGAITALLFLSHWHDRQLHRLRR